jgi:hypothetical protein
MKHSLILFSFFISFLGINAQSYQIALLKYGGGGDWYANLETSLPNLIAFTNKELGMQINPEQAIVEVGSVDIFNYPFVHMTGHGNILFSRKDVDNLRMYLSSGGFLHIDDNYGMDPFIRLEMKKVFPELDWIPLPATHPIFHQKFKFPEGLPKIHEHDNKAPEALGLFWKGRLVCLYTFEADLGDGWESQQVHNNPESKRLEALRMGANLLQFVFTNYGNTQ